MRKTSQQGMTLVELIIAMSISVMIMGSLGSALYQILGATEQGNDQMKALHNIQNAAYWLSIDGQRAETTDLAEGAQPVNSVRLDWSDRYGDSHYSVYSLSDTDLQRNCDGTVMTVARYISSVEFSITGDLITFRVESSPTGRQEVVQERTYKVCLRPMS